jgi:hypothetical protein
MQAHRRLETHTFSHLLLVLVVLAAGPADKPLPLSDPRFALSAKESCASTLQGKSVSAHFETLVEMLGSIRLGDDQLAMIKRLVKEVFKAERMVM